ncbi:MAG: trypsin-like peptidase domain-containing protein [Planctomycetia bacterium]|nr:trypsin-like peptidase domain-containing protein [Planctomycetia bacterium]
MFFSQATLFMMAESTFSDLIGTIPVWTIPAALLAILFAQFLFFCLIASVQKLKSILKTLVVLIGVSMLLCVLVSIIEPEKTSTKGNPDHKAALDRSSNSQKKSIPFQNTSSESKQGEKKNNVFRNANGDRPLEGSSVADNGASYYGGERSASRPETNGVLIPNGTGTFIAPPQYPNGSPSASAAGNSIRSSEYNPQGNNQGTISPAGFNTTAPGIPSTPDLFGKGSALLNRESFDTIQHLSNENKREAILRARAAVVHIEAEVYKDKRKEDGRIIEETGSGFLIQNNGRFFILTNNHVAGRAVSKDRVSITFRNLVSVHPIMIFPCPQADLALLEIDRSDLPATIFKELSGKIQDQDVLLSVLGNSDAISEMDEVYSIGSPYGLSGTLTRGIISGLNRQNIPLGTPDQIQGFMQTDASVNPGNSGGPLVNEKGEVIGIVTAIASKTGQGSGIAFALPINTVNAVVDQIIQAGNWNRGYMGVELEKNYSVAKHMEDGLDRQIGARVLEVKKGSPAEGIGLIRGDVILSFNGLEIRDEHHLKQLIGLTAPGTKTEIIVWRDRREYLATPTLNGQTVYAPSQY